MRNAKAAMLAAIEIYNKPRFNYRDECFVILLLNAWELILKALLSKQGKSIFYPKKRKQPYRTLSWQDALARVEGDLPKGIGVLPLRRNLEMLSTYRDNSVHFYNALGFGVLVYALAQTAVMNFRDLLQEAFGQRLEDEITWQLLPLALKPPIDPIAYIQNQGANGRPTDAAVKQYLSEIAAVTKEIEDAKADTGRFMTVFKVKLESTKKLGTADIVVGIGIPAGADGPLVVNKSVDPNISHPIRQTEVLQKVGTLHGKRFTSGTFQALLWKHDIRSKPNLCWQAKEGVLTKYSNDLIGWIKGLSENDIAGAVSDYRKHLAKRRNEAKGNKG